MTKEEFKSRALKKVIGVLMKYVYINDCPDCIRDTLFYIREYIDEKIEEWDEA